MRTSVVWMTPWQERKHADEMAHWVASQTGRQTDVINGFRMIYHFAKGFAIHSAFHSLAYAAILFVVCDCKRVKIFKYSKFADFQFRSIVSYRFLGEIKG